MKILPIKISILLIALNIINCKNDQPKNIAEKKPLHQYIDKIDSLPLSESIFIINFDKENNRLDTIGLRNLKYDENNFLVYENNVQLKSKIETFNYYTSNNGMVYSKGLKNQDMIFEFWVDLEDGLILSAYHNMFWNGKTDSVFMDYHYTFENGKKKQLLIDSKDDFSTIEFYNAFEKPSLHLSKFQNDTLDLTEFFYENNELKKKNFKNIQQNEEIIYEYADEFLIRETFLRNGEKVYQTDYSKDENGNYLSQTENFFK